MKVPETINTDTPLWLVVSAGFDVDSIWANREYAWHHAKQQNQKLERAGLKPILSVRSYPTKLGEVMLGDSYPEIE